MNNEMVDRMERWLFIKKALNGIVKDMAHQHI